MNHHTTPNPVDKPNFVVHSYPIYILPIPLPGSLGGDEETRGKKMKRWIISDTHFNHKNIIQYCSRPFKDVNHMNEVLITNWNSVVSPEDTVIHCGDFGFGSIAALSGLRERLNGKIILVCGNHDRNPTAMTKCGFIGLSQYEEDGMYFTHVPPEVRLGNLMHVHGHIHNTERENEKEWWKVNVSVEVINYTPISPEEVRKISEENKEKKEKTC